MKVIEYIKNNGIDSLTDIGIIVKKYDDRVVLNYHQIDSPKYHPVVMECRNLILSMEDYSIISRSYKRFFNINEWGDDPFDYSNIDRIEEKADGSLSTVYYHKGEWCVSTRKTAFSETEVSGDSSITFYELFINTISCDLDELMSGLDTSLSYVFELCSLYNKVVKSYNTPCCYFITAFRKNTGEEISPSQADSMFSIMKTRSDSIKRPTIYEFSNIDDLENSFETLDKTDEGYVIVDIHGNRIKVKNPSYVNLHRISNNIITRKTITTIVFDNEVDEVLVYFPEYADIFEKYTIAYKKMMNDIEKYSKFVNMDRKEFALMIKDIPAKGIIFSIANGMSVNEAIDRLNIQYKVRLLENYMQCEG